MKNTTWPLQKTDKHFYGRRSRFLWRVACVLILLVGLCTISLAIPSPAHAATTDCHDPYTAPGNAYLLTSASYTIVENDGTGTPPTAMGDLEISLLYCPAFQSVFGRFVFSSVDGSSSLTGVCDAIDDTGVGSAGIGFQSGCTDGLPSGQSIDTQIISASGDSWHASWTNQGLNVFCQASDGTLMMICQTPSAATPAS